MNDIATSGDDPAPYGPWEYAVSDGFHYTAGPYPSRTGVYPPLNTTLPEEQDKPKSPPMGWMCPVCHRGLAIWMSVCPCYEERNVPISATIDSIS